MGGKALHSKAPARVWTTQDCNKEERQAETVKAQAGDTGWRTNIGQIKNKCRDSHLEGQSMCLIAAEERVIKRPPKN